MKSRKTRMFAALWLVAVSGFSLMVASAAVTEKTIKSDLTNAIQRIPRVRIVSKDYDKKSTLENLNQLFRIEMEDGIGFVLWNPSSKANGSSATVLWWRANTANSQYSTIIWWDTNRIVNSSAATILWWWGNIFEDGWSNGSIVWWSGNKISGISYSTIVGTNNIGWWNGSYSVIVWSNSSVNSGRSVALWEGSNNRAGWSFLWTDGNHTGSLWSSNTFAVVSDKWMVVNEDRAHDFAKLTIWWSLIIDNSDHDPICNSDHFWVLKVVSNESNTSISCFCSCAENGWTSLFGAWMCSSSCQASITPTCGNEVTKICNATWYVYSWTCIEWEVVEWTWAYVVEDNGKIRRTCQTNDGARKSCRTGAISTLWSCVDTGVYKCMWNYDHAEFLSWRAVNLTFRDRLTSQVFNSVDEIPDDVKCAWVCKPEYHKVWKYCVAYKSCDANSHFKPNEIIEIFPWFEWFNVSSPLNHGASDTFYHNQVVEGWVRKCIGEISCNDWNLVLNSHNSCQTTFDCNSQIIEGYTFPKLRVWENGTAYDTWYVYSDWTRWKTPNANIEWYYSCTQWAWCDDDGNARLLWWASCTYRCERVTKNGYIVPALANGMTGNVLGNATDITTPDWQVVWKRVCYGQFQCNNGVVNYLWEVNCRDEIDPCEPQTIDGYEITTYIANGGTGMATKRIPDVWACLKIASCSYGKIELWEAFCNLACKAWENPQGEGVIKWSASYQDEWHTPDAWKYRASGTLWACEWRCNSSYEKDGNRCKPKVTYTTCGGTEPSWEWVEKWDTTYPAQSTQKTWDYTTNGTLWACQWTCNSATHEKDGNGCKPKWSPYTTCGEEKPTGDGYLFGESSYTPASYTPNTWTYVDKDASDLYPCEFTCDAASNYIWDANANICKQPTSSSCSETQANKCIVDGNTVDGTSISHTDNEYIWSCGEEPNKFECGLCDEDSPHAGEVPETLRDQFCKAPDPDPDPDPEYCPELCNYNSDVTDVIPTCLNGATVTGLNLWGGGWGFTLIPGKTVWNGDTVRRWCQEPTKWLVVNCSLTCPRCTWTTGTNVVLNNNKSPSTSTNFSYNTNTNLACTYRCRNTYDWVYNAYTREYECKDPHHYEWRFYKNSVAQESLTWTRQWDGDDDKWDRRGKIWGVYFSTSDDTPYRYCYDCSNSSDNWYYYGSTYPSSSCTCNEYSDKVFHHMEWWWWANGDKIEWSDPAWLSNISSYRWWWYSTSNDWNYWTKVTIDLRNYYEGWIPMYNGSLRNYMSLSCWHQAFDWRQCQVTFANDTPSTTRIYANSDTYKGRTITLYWYVIDWYPDINDRGSGFGDNRAYAGVIEPYDFENITAISTPIYYNNCPTQYVGERRYLVQKWDHGTPRYDVSAYEWECEYNATFVCNNGTWEMRGSEELVDSNCNPNNTCFLEWTPVLTKDGSKNIEDIQVGDIVLSYNTDTNSYEYQHVVEKHVHENSDDEIYELTIDWNKLEVTYAHRFYVKVDDNGYQCVVPYEWKGAARLTVGDELLMADGTYATIENITHHPNHSTTYNFQVENNHNYFVGEWYLVHNKKMNPADPREPVNPYDEPQY